MPKNIEIEHLRALAIILTLLAHLSFVSPYGNATYSYIVNNTFQFWGGVDLFFCISGFVISKTLISKIDSSKNEIRKNIVKSFYIKRVWRIVPLSLFWILYIVLASIFFNNSGVFGGINETFKHALAAMFFYENIYLTFILHHN